MTLGEKIKIHRQAAGLSQEKIAELVGVSRQAVAKWESDRSAPTTSNLLKLAGILGISIDVLLDQGYSPEPATAEQVCQLYKKEQETVRIQRARRIKQRLCFAALIACAYLAIYLAGRFLWCGLDGSSFLGWLWLTPPSGPHSYLYGWLLSSNLFWWAMAISVFAALCGKDKFSLTTLAAFLLGLVSGMIFGPNPAGAPYGQGHYGWAIWGCIYLLSMVVGTILEKRIKKDVWEVFCPKKP